MDSLLEVGQIVNSYGIKGFLKVVPLVDDNNHFKEFKKLYILDNKELKIEEVYKSCKDNRDLPFEEIDHIELRDFYDDIIYTYNKQEN